jgi:hypothetical protein
LAASSTLPQQNVSRKSPISKTGVLTLSGFGIKVRMQRGHLEIEDGVGMERRTIRLPRVGHGLKRSSFEDAKKNMATELQAHIEKLLRDHPKKSARRVA